ncbi:glycosyltransferase [bacterium]|nr:glycosyltransferase [bacterium]
MFYTLNIIFTASIGLLLYHLFLFPVVLVLWAKLKPAPKIKKNYDYKPSITLLISARNEASGISAKIENSLGLDYPREKLRIVVVANGCTDNTAEIAQSFVDRGVQVLEYGAVGKSIAQNLAVPETTGDILIFSDANTLYEPQSVNEIAALFADSNVGAVSGHHVHVGEKEALSRDTENVYYGIAEKFLKEYESRIGGLISAAGSIYAVRRDLYVPVKKECTSDFIEPLLISMRGYRVSFADKARSLEVMEASEEEEYRRKIRVVRHGVSSILLYPQVLNFFKHPRVAFLVFSHKVLRWLVPFFLSILFTVSFIRLIAKRGILIDKLIFGGTTLGGFVALLGRGLGVNRKVPLLSQAYYGFLILKSIMEGTLQAIKDGGVIEWDHKR